MTRKIPQTIVNSTNAESVSSCTPPLIQEHPASAIDGIKRDPLKSGAGDEFQIRQYDLFQRLDLVVIGSDCVTPS